MKKLKGLGAHYNAINFAGFNMAKAICESTASKIRGVIAANEKKIHHKAARESVNHLYFKNSALEDALKILDSEVQRLSRKMKQSEDWKNGVEPTLKRRKDSRSNVRD